VSLMSNLLNIIVVVTLLLCSSAGTSVPSCFPSNNMRLSFFQENFVFLNKLSVVSEHCIASVLNLVFWTYAALEKEDAEASSGQSGDVFKL